MDHHLREIADCLDEVLRIQSRVMELTEQVSEAAGMNPDDRTLRGKVTGLFFRRPSVSGGAQSPSQRHGVTGRRSTPLGSGVWVHAATMERAANRRASMANVGVGRAPHRHLDRVRRRRGAACKATAGARQSSRRAATMTTVICDSVLPRRAAPTARL